MSTTPIAALQLAAMHAALDEARAAAFAGEVPVGAVVLRNGEIVARAQNRMKRDGDSTSHAELLVLRDVAASDGVHALDGATLVVTLEPCAMCAGAIVLSRVPHLIFGAWDDKAGMCGSVGDVVRHQRLNHAPSVQGGVLADDSARLLRDFFSARR